MVFATAANASNNPAGMIHYYNAENEDVIHTLSVTAGSTIVGSTTSINLDKVGRKQVGTTTIWAFFIPSDTVNYSNSNRVSTTVTVANKRTVTITAPTATNRTYNGIVQEIFEEGSCTEGGVMYYSITDKDFSTSTWKQSLSFQNASADMAGTYTLYYYCYVSDTSNNTGTGINTKKSISATINKATPTLTFTASTSTLTYNGSTQNIGTISYNGDGKIYYVVSRSNTTPTTGWIETSTGATIKSSEATAGIYYVYLKADAGTNYNAIAAKNSGSKAIDKATGYLTASVNAPLTYNGGAQTIATISTNSGDYYFGIRRLSNRPSAPTWGSANTALSATNVGTYEVWVRCDASINYNNVTPKKVGAVVINQRTVTVTAPTATNRIYNGRAQTIFTAGHCEPVGGGVMYYSSTDIPFSTSTWSTTLPYTQKSAIGEYTLYYYCYVSDTSNNKGAGINTVNSVSATIDRVIEDYINMVTCDASEGNEEMWTTTLTLNNNLIMPTHWIGQEIYFRVYDDSKNLILQKGDESIQYSFRITQDFTTGNSKYIEIIKGPQASLCGEKFGYVVPCYIKIERKEGTGLSENYVPFAGRYIDVDYR